MTDDILNLKTDKALLEALEAAAKRSPTHDEMVEQKVSFIFSSMDAKSGVTKQQIKEVISKQI